jgi:hypothetical protein
MKHEHKDGHGGSGGRVKQNDQNQIEHGDEMLRKRI